MYYAIEIIGARRPRYCIKQVTQSGLVIPVNGKAYRTEEAARAAAAETLADVKRAMKINYFDPGVLEELIAEQSQKYSK